MHTAHNEHYVLFLIRTESSRSLFGSADVVFIFIHFNMVQLLDSTSLEHTTITDENYPLNYLVFPQRTLEHFVHTICIFFFSFDRSVFLHTIYCHDAVAISTTTADRMYALTKSKNNCSTYENAKCKIPKRLGPTLARYKRYGTRLEVLINETMYE